MGKYMVQLGRVVLILKGPDAGKIAVIVDIIDQNRALIDGPKSGVKRQPILFKNIRLTKFVVSLPHGAKTSFVSKLVEKDELNKKWAETAKSKQLQAKKKRSEMNDFDRFKLYKVKQRFNRAIKAEVRRLKSADKKKPKAGKAKAKAK